MILSTEGWFKEHRCSETVILSTEGWFRERRCSETEIWSTEGWFRVPQNLVIVGDIGPNAHREAEAS